MAATYLLFGDPDWVGVLHYLVFFTLIVAGFVLTVFVICKKVFGGRGRQQLLTIDLGAKEARTNEQR